MYTRENHNDAEIIKWGPKMIKVGTFNTFYNKKQFSQNLTRQRKEFKQGLGLGSKLIKTKVCLYKFYQV